jgi:hypothetical protein
MLPDEGERHHCGRNIGSELLLRQSARQRRGENLSLRFAFGWAALPACPDLVFMSATRNYLDSKPVNSSVAFELRTSSICRDSTRAFAFKASIVELWGCNFSSSSIRLLNDASSSRSRSISALRLSTPTGFQTLCALMMMRPLL